MALTIGFTSMDQATETALRAAFADANQQLHGRFSLASESAADYVVIDMDSMYGPMGWLRLHAAGKQVVGLTASARTQADFRLGRPFDTPMIVALLREIAAGSGADITAPVATVPQPDDASVAFGPASSTMPVPDAESTAGDDSTATIPAAGPESFVPPAGQEPDLAPAPEAEPAPAPEAEPESVAVARERTLADWLQPGTIDGRVRYRCDNGRELWIDVDAGQYYGPSLLKPLAACFQCPVQRADLETVAPEAWEAGTGAAGPAQPLARLLWLGGLLAGNGTLLPGYDPDGRYRLTRWPQTEREYPRHFRIATVMMKGPATLQEVAEASGAPAAEVADFTNASLATGYAEFVPEPEPEPEPPPKSAGFFSRLRRKS